MFDSTVLATCWGLKLFIVLQLGWGSSGSPSLALPNLSYLLCFWAPSLPAFFVPHLLRAVMSSRPV